MATQHFTSEFFHKLNERRNPDLQDPPEVTNTIFEGISRIHESISGILPQQSVLFFQSDWSTSDFAARPFM
jgi:hypothetical protein